MARFTKSKVPTVEDIESLAIQAAKGDAGALERLGALNEKLGRRANQNIRTLEKMGYTKSDAYKQAEYMLGGDGKTRFSQSKKAAKGLENMEQAADRLASEAKKAAKFLRYQTSTVGGVRAKAKKGSEKVKAKITAALGEQGVKVSDKQIQENLDKFLRSDAFAELKATQGSPIIEKVAEKISAGADVDELINLFTQWQEGDIDGGILTVWDMWEKMT